MPLSALTPPSSKYTAGAITVAEVITMDGVEVITMDGAIITIGETSVPSGNHSGRSRLSLAAFSLRESALATQRRKSRQGFPRRPVPLRDLRSGLPRRAALEAKP
jgi:hypothetical protein